MDSDSQSPHHVVFFPFMAKGHTIPLLHLLRLLRRRFPHLCLTIFTTAANRPFISQFLSDSGTDSISIVDLSFPKNAPGLPAGVESVDTLPSLSLQIEFWTATELMQPEFEKRLQSLPVPVTFLVSDMFFWWTLESASKFGIPRIYFNGMSSYVVGISSAILKHRDLDGVQSDDELVTVTDFPWVKICRRDCDPIFWSEAERTSLHFQLVMKAIHAAINSYGLIVNSFYELEPRFCDYMRSSEKVWTIGPLCLDPYNFDSGNHEWTQKPQTQQAATRQVVEWLEGKLREGEGVLYVAFGSQGEISSEQVKEIETGLEESGVNFLWVKRDKEMEDKGFEERIKERGYILREWVDQWEVLKHEAVKGFLSHCGWNSVVESLSCGVPILAYPLVADQRLNARMVVEELRTGMRGVEGSSAMNGCVKGKDLKRSVRELMEGEKGKEVRKKAMEIGEMAKKAMAENGSSWRNLELLIQEMCNKSPLSNTDLPAINEGGVNFAQ